MRLLSSPIYSYVSRNRKSGITRALMRFSNLVRRAYHNSSNHDIRTNGEALVLRKCYDSRLDASRPFVVFDVGANTGEWTLNAIEICDSCVAHLFEIVPETCKTLHEVLGNTQGVTINQCGLSNSDDNIQIRYYPTANTGSSEYALPWGIEHVMVDVEVLRGDSYIESNNIDRIDFLKIDVEGSDYKVLQGFESALSEGRISFIQFEYNKAAILSRIFLRDFYLLLERYGFVIGPIMPNGVEFMEYNLFCDETLLQSNFLAARKELQGLIHDA